MFGGGALAAKIAGFGTSLRLFFRPSRLSRDGLKNEPCENPKSVICSLNSLPEYTSGITSKQALSKSLKKYELLLDNQIFMRTHNRYLINLKKVRRFVKSEGGYILMNNDARISISPKKRQEFLDRMEQLS